MRVGVDGIAEQHELDDRHAHHHREGQAVPERLDELLQQERAEARGGEAGHALFSCSGTATVIVWMKTSSSVGSTRSMWRPSSPSRLPRLFSSSAGSSPVTS